MTITTKLNPQKLLSKLAETKSSGCLELTAELVLWKIYLDRGNIQYVYCSVQTLDRLKYHLYSLELKQAIAAIQKIPKSVINLQDFSPSRNIYSQTINWLLTEKAINLSQSCQLIKSISQDDLFNCLWQERGVSEWHQEHSIPLWIPQQIRDSLSLNISKCLNNAKLASEQWQTCCPQLTSIYQRPYFPPSWESKSLPDSGTLDRKTLMELTKVLKGRTSIRQLSILLKKDELKIAKILSPYIEERIIYLHHPSSPLSNLPYIPRVSEDILKNSLKNEEKLSQNHQSNSRSTKILKIVCIDDSPTILNEIRRFLDKNKFEITTVNDPIQAVSRIFTIQPDLILLDITMPKINGYKLCGLLRSSGKCDNTPIVMVTGNTGLIDKARAKLAGATDYFTKPFTKEGLNKIVSKYLPQ